MVSSLPVFRNLGVKNQLLGGSGRTATTLGAAACTTLALGTGFRPEVLKEAFVFVGCTATIFAFGGTGVVDFRGVPWAEGRMSRAQQRMDFTARSNGFFVN